MNWITTNIRFPEDMYMDLKMEAAKKRKSVAEIVRQKVSKKKTQSKSKKANVEKIMYDLDKLARENDKYVPKGKNFSDLLIEMRYEQ